MTFISLCLILAVYEMYRVPHWSVSGISPFIKRAGSQFHFQEYPRDPVDFIVTCF